MVISAPAEPRPGGQRRPPQSSSTATIRRSPTPIWPPRCSSEIRLLRACQAELAAHAQRREEAYRWADPGQLARSLPGLAEIGGPAAAAGIGRPGRFPSGRHFKSYLGLTPKASETGETDRKGQAISKAGSSLLRTTFIRAADTARKQDPQLARVYYVQMTERGADHIKALCVVAGHLAERFWAVMTRGMPYVVCDTDGNPVTPAEAKTIIAEQWTVPAAVRARRRSRKKAGKAPQQALPGMTGQARKVPTNEAAFPTAHRQSRPAPKASGSPS